MASRRIEPHPGIPAPPLVAARPGAQRPLSDLTNWSVPRSVYHRRGVHWANPAFTTPPRSGYVMIASKILTRAPRGAMQTVYTALRFRAQKPGILV